MTKLEEARIDSEWLKQHHIFCRWIRGGETVDFNKPKTYLCLGQRGSGKSSLLECIGSNFPKIIDLFGSRDNEGLAWCRSPFKDNVLFVVGSTKVSSEWNCKKFMDLKPSDFNDYQVITSVHGFYGKSDEEFIGLNHILDVLYHRTHWTEPWYLLVREAANFIYSRIKLNQNQLIAKADFIYLLREARHMGYAVGVDTIRWTAIDVEVRDVSDYTFLKSVGRKGLPYDLHFVYRYINPYSMMNTKKNQFVLVTDTGSIGLGRFGYPYWHKVEKEDLFQKLNIQVEPTEVPNYGEGSAHGRPTVSDFEHAEMLKRRKAGATIEKIAEDLHRSSSTVATHVEEHNKYPEGECPRCRRIQT